MDYFQGMNFLNRNIQFKDIADQKLINSMRKPIAFKLIKFTDSEWSIQNYKITLTQYVPFHFIEPAKQIYIPPDVFVWEYQHGIELDYWILNPEFLFQNDHYVCIGHWKSGWRNSKFLLENFGIFEKLLTETNLRYNISRELGSRESSDFLKFFNTEIPNILNGKVQPIDDTCKHLMGSSIFVRNAVPPGYLTRLCDINQMCDLQNDWKIII